MQSKKALVVDDNKTNLKIIVETLSSWGMSATPFSSPKRVLDLNQSLSNFDVFILDMQMPEMDGVQLAKEISEIVNDKSKPIIILSSTPEHLLEEERLNHYDYFMNKPLKQSKLLSVFTQIWRPEIRENAKLNAKKGYTYQAEQTDRALKILIVEDNAINQAVANKALEVLGHDATTMKNGKEALALMKGELFDVILMDIQMPEMDGIETTRMIKKLISSNEQPVIIAMTANNRKDAKDTYIQEGMDDFIPKPMDIDQLSYLLRKWFPTN